MLQSLQKPYSNLTEFHLNKLHAPACVYYVKEIAGNAVNCCMISIFKKSAIHIYLCVYEFFYYKQIHHLFSAVFDIHN